MPHAGDWHKHVRIFAQQNRSEEHTSELQSQSNLVCRLLLEKKKLIIRLDGLLGRDREIVSAHLAIGSDVPPSFVDSSGVPHDVLMHHHYALSDPEPPGRAWD